MWTELREYRVWCAEDIHDTVHVMRHTNGRYNVFTDSGVFRGVAPFRTCSEEWALRHAKILAQELMTEATAQCPCEANGWNDDGECSDPESNPYDSPHGVRLQVVDAVTHCTVDNWDL